MADNSRETVRDNITKEYQEFCDCELRKTNKEIFNNSLKIEFYRSLHRYFTDQNNACLEEKYYESLKEEKDRVLSLLYEEYLNIESASVVNYEDITDFVKVYCENYYEEILGGNELE